MDEELLQVWDEIIMCPHGHDLCVLSYNLFDIKVSTQTICIILNVVTAYI